MPVYMCVFNFFSETTGPIKPKCMWNQNRTGADTGFLEKGFKITKGGSFYPTFLINPHENGIIWPQRGVRANPLWIRHCRIGEES